MMLLDVFININLKFLPHAKSIHEENTLRQLRKKNFSLQKRKHNEKLTYIKALKSFKKKKRETFILKKENLFSSSSRKGKRRLFTSMHVDSSYLVGICN